MKTPYIITIILTSLMIGGYLIFRSRRKITDAFNSSEVQKINVLQLGEVMNWAINILNTREVENSAIEINILPNKATLETFKGSLKLKKKFMEHCYLIVILQSNNVIARKLVIADEISDELRCISNNKIFAIPVE